MPIEEYVLRSQNILDTASEEVQTQLSRIKSERLYPLFLERIVATLEALLTEGHSFWATTGMRTVDEQNAIYQIGRRNIEGEHVKTLQKGGWSAHQYGIAIDFAYNLRPEQPGLHPSWDVSYLKLLADKAVENGLESGLLWKTMPDGPHIQFPIMARSISPRHQLLEAYNQGQLLRVFEWLDEQNWD